jgi:cytochrome c-type biogenesis protein
MQFVLLFLEGVITFVSPCLLPLLPVYLLYFSGGGKDESNGLKTLVNACGFVIGFTIIFVALGAFAGTIGGFLVNYSRWINIISGLVVISFGLNYLGVINLRFFQIPKNFRFNLGKAKPSSFPSAIIFGIVFSIAWTPCVSAFLGAALLRAAGQGSAPEGMAMLFVYSLGLGLPFIISAVLIDKLKNAFSFIKNNYRVVNILSGSLLVLVGILMMAGLFEVFFS